MEFGISFGDEYVGYTRQKGGLLRITNNGDREPLVFHTEADSQFLILGKIYPVKLRSGDREMYLEPVKGGLFKPISVPGDNVLSYTVLQPGMIWGEVYPASQVRFSDTRFENATVKLESGTSGVAVTTLQELQESRPIDQISDRSQGFGLRGPDGVYTYTVDDGEVTVGYVKNQNVSYQVDTQDIVTEKPFYFDYLPGTTALVPGMEYPIYIYIDGDRKYLSSPKRAGPNGPTKYTPTDSPTGDTARLFPTSAFFWREYALTPGNFQNLVYDTPQALGLWNDVTYSQTLATEANPLTGVGAPPGVVAQERVQQAVRAEDTQPLKPVEPVVVNPPVPIYKKWWFWVLIFIAALVVAALLSWLVYFLTKPKPDTTTVYIPFDEYTPGKIRISPNGELY